MIENARIALTNRGFKNIYETRAGATISSHCGERTLGILFINN
jgi:fatty acid-binding protein DegV